MADNRDRTGRDAGEGRGRISVSRAPRLAGYTFYGISRERYRELRDGCRRGAYSREILFSACSEVPELAEYILLSVREGLSYDALERQWGWERSGGWHAAGRIFMDTGGFSIFGWISCCRKNKH